MMTDPIADLLTRIRNINRLGRGSVSAPHSKVKEEIVKTLHREGFIDSYEVEEKDKRRHLKIKLKYGPEGEQVIRCIERVSRPGCRTYKGVGELTPILRGQGVQVVSTSKGVLSDNETRAQKVGGEVICQVY